MTEDKNILEMRNIVKTFPGVQALKGVDLNVKYGEIHALLGENGAGKSTLVKCLIGIYQKTSGEIVFESECIDNYTTADALRMGISMIHQELSPVEHRSIMENIWLGREPKTKLGFVDHNKMYEITKEVLKRIDLDEDPKTLMADLSVAKIQMIEIAKAISYNAKLIIMDEPTSALTNKEIDQLFTIMRKLKEEGKSIIYISHKLEEIFTICDTITVYRDGEYIGTERVSDIDTPTLIKMMVGRNVNELYPKVKCDTGDIKLEVDNLTSEGAFRDVSFKVRKGEILGIAGLVGAGRTELIETLFGLRKKTYGQIKIDGKEVDVRTPQEAKGKKMALLTEDRRLNGIFPMLTVFQNITIANLFKYENKFRLFNHKEAIRDVNEYVESIQIKTPSIYQRMENLSGGNQQKVLVARWLMTSPEILIMDEPTRGIDVGAKAEIYKLISTLAEQGKSVILVSSELPEVMRMSDTIMVMYEGRVAGILNNSKDLTQEEIMHYATGQIMKDKAEYM
ncbi:sugar ABC transporter ATP-binding protein [Schnuerera sp. xch1]|uniref:sugar ABC transporter ATP-binding protein n=1 Tax=Schnuerera sp. xch1 TaxID=2874283 RepID=UPI001CBACD89|nr:sugar ABC transporter ATP-binding protein [Schnuerera sp. xch1]MBZ2175878.1 sugar ABC transporter ATP-binding protein [Schnuerera sp. xch1]